MIIDPDHLSQASRDELFAVTESKDYSGLVSSHSWSNDKDYPRIMRNGGVVAPNDNNTKGYFENWKRLRKQRGKGYFYGIGYGADMNGFSSSAGPIGDEVKISYPFKTVDGNVTIQKQKSGERTFDINEDGISHYGLFPDWVEALRKLGGDEIANDMANGAEAYLQMWERAVGVPGPKCRSRTARLRSRGVRRIDVGLAANAFLRRAGQPQQRGGRVWRWCVNKRAIERTRITAVLTPNGRSALVATNARGQRAGKIGVGDPVKRVAGGENRPPAASGRCGPEGQRFVYGTRARQGDVRRGGDPAAAKEQSCALPEAGRAAVRRLAAVAAGRCRRLAAGRRGGAARGEDPAHQVRRPAHHREEHPEPRRRLRVRVRAGQHLHDRQRVRDRARGAVEVLRPGQGVVLLRQRLAVQEPRRRHLLPVGEAGEGGREAGRQEAARGPDAEVRRGVKGYVAGYNKYLRDVGRKRIPDRRCRGAVGAPDQASSTSTGASTSSASSRAPAR